MLKITPFKNVTDKKDEHRQSKYDQVPKCFLRSMILGASNSGKTVLLSRMIIDIYDKCFDKIYIFSKTALIDPSYRNIFAYMDQINDEKDGSYMLSDYVFSEVDKLDEIMKNQDLLTKYTNSMKINTPKILIVFDDILHLPENSNNRNINSLIMYRHICISSIYLCQRITYCKPNIRVNLTSIFIFKQSNSTDIQEISSEYRGTLTNNEFMNIYKRATEEPYSFLYINLNSNVEDKKKFLKNFESYLYFK
jgi:hypothetical protein